MAASVARIHVVVGQQLADCGYHAASLIIMSGTLAQARGDVLALCSQRRRRAADRGMLIAHRLQPRQPPVRPGGNRSRIPRRIVIAALSMMIMRAV